MRFLLASVLSELLMSEPVSEMEMKRGKRFLATLVQLQPTTSEINSREETTTGEPESNEEVSINAIIETSTEPITEATTKNATTGSDTKEGTFEDAEEVTEESDLLLVCHGRKSIELRSRTQKERADKPTKRDIRHGIKRHDKLTNDLEEAKNSCNREKESSLPVDLHQWYNCVFNELEAKKIMKYFKYLPWICRRLSSDENGLELPCDEIDAAYETHGGLPHAVDPQTFPTSPNSPPVQLKDSSSTTEEKLNDVYEYCSGADEDSEVLTLESSGSIPQLFADFVAGTLTSHYICVFREFKEMDACRDLKYEPKLCSDSMNYEYTSPFSPDVGKFQPDCDAILQAFNDCGEQLEEKVEETVPDEE